jgi:hypothetical protein
MKLSHIVLAQLLALSTTAFAQSDTGSWVEPSIGGLNIAGDSDVTQVCKTKGFNKVDFSI